MDARQKLSLASMLLQLLIDGKFVDARSGKVFGTEVSNMFLAVWLHPLVWAARSRPYCSVKRVFSMRLETPPGGAHS